MRLLYFLFGTLGRQGGQLVQLSLTTNFLLPTILDFYSNCRCQCEQSLASRPGCFSLTFQGVVTRHAAEPTVFGRQSLASFQVRPSIVSIIPRARASVVYPCHGSSNPGGPSVAHAPGHTYISRAKVSSPRLRRLRHSLNTVH